MLPLASNDQGKIQQADGLTQIVLQVAKGRYGPSICPPADQPYDCASISCSENADNVCKGMYTDTCPYTKCPSFDRGDEVKRKDNKDGHIEQLRAIQS